MAFIDNSGDIILDAVLTDLGRELLARGDGSFKLVSFGLGDDEINYGLYDTTLPDNAAASTIKQLPIFESLTNNTVALKYRLLNIVRNDLLYLPIMKLNELLDSTKKTTSGYFAVCVDKDTEDLIFASGDVTGVLAGANPNDQASFVRIDQGWDTNQIPFDQTLPPDLFETDYRIQIDYRFGRPLTLDGSAWGISSIDKNNMGSYDASMNLSTPGSNASLDPVVGINNTTDSKLMTITGPRGSKLRFKMRAASQLQNSTALFVKFGNTMSSSTFLGSASDDLYYIDTILRVLGGVTGYQIDIPVRFIKKK